MRLYLLLPLALLTSCATFSMEIPEGFRRYHQDPGFKLITADGVMLEGREVENYPRADLPFWVDALKRHMAERGYALKGEDCFETQEGLDGCAVDFVMPHGSEDWVLSECLFVVDDRIILLESAGPYERFVQVEEALQKAFRTFRLSDA